MIGIFQQPCLEQWKDNFPTFAGVIERKLGEEAYGGLHFNNFRIIGFVDCKIARSVKLAVLDRALQRTGSKLRGTTMRGFYKNLFIQATSDIMGLKFFLLFFQMV